MQTTDLIHVVVVIVGLIVYGVLTALGHDGTAALAAALGYGGGAGVSALTPTRGSSGGGSATG